MQVTIPAGGNECGFFARLIYILTAKNEAVYRYHNAGFWFDIGKQDDYARSIDEFGRYKDRFLS